MGKYVIKRVGYMFVVLIILSFLMFMIYNLVPANRAYTDARTEVNALKNSIPADELDARFDELYLKYQRLYGTDTDNKIVRYLRWIGVYPLYDGSYSGLLQGNFGYSYQMRDDVINIVGTPMLNTIKINIFSTVLALCITIPLGIISAVNKGSKFDLGIRFFTLIGYSLPTFVIAIMFIWFFCSTLGILPPSGMKTPGTNYVGWERLLDEAYYMILPLITMTFCSMGGMTRYVRASMIDALTLDCVKTARAKGLREKVVIFSHAWRNALIPIVTLVVGWFLGIFSGSLVMEQMFGRNGMGNLMITSLQTQDFDVVILMQMFYVIISLSGNLIIDLVYGLVDPRVRVNK